MRRYILFLYSSFRNIVKYIIASGFCIVNDSKFLPYHFGILSNKNRVKFYSQKKKKIHIIFEHTKDIRHILYACILLLFVYFQLIYTHTHTYTCIFVYAPKTYAPLLFFFCFSFFFVFVISLRHQSGPLMPGPTYINVCACVCVCIPSLSTHTLIDAAPTVVVVVAVAVAACCQRQNATSKIK